MKWMVYFVAWLLFVLFSNIADVWHEEALNAGEPYTRKGFWEMLWYGAGCCAAFQFFEEIWP